MSSNARPALSLKTLRALRRDVAVLAVAGCVSVSSAAWLHAQAQMCTLDAEPSAPVAQLTPDVAVAPTDAVVREPAPLTYGEHYAFVVDLEEPYIVLATDVDASWEGELGPLLGVDTVFRDVDVPALPLSLQDMRGREVQMWTSESDGTPVALGAARIGAPRLVAQAAGSLGPDARLDTWSLYEQLERDGVLPSSLEARVKSAIWAEGLRLLVAPLEGARASEATWARAAELPTPLFYASQPLDESRSGALRQAFLAEQDGRTAGDEHIRQGFGSLEPHILTRGWVDPDGALRLATAFVDSPHVDICGGFDWSFSMAGRIEGKEWVAPAAIPTNHTTGPAIVGDLNADGFADMVLEPRPLDGNTTVLRGTTEGFDVVDALGEVPYFGCRC
ncbi:MAG: hypothetical protein ACE37F_00075 [Nannocystaceae bacterium]|nr:hypothetical protein [bacterium]